MLQRDEHAVVRPRRAPGLVQQHQREQSAWFGLGRHQPDQHPGQPNGLGRQCAALVEVVVVALVEDQVEHGEDACQPFRQQLRRGHPVGMPASRILRLARTRRCAIVGSAVRRARAISAVLRPASVRRVSATRAGNGSAGWQHVKISRSRSSGISSVRRLVRVALEHGPLAQLRRPRAVPAQPVGRAVAGRRGEPGARSARDAVARPRRQRRGEGVLCAVLGQVPVAGHPDHGGHHLTPLVPVGRLGRRAGPVVGRRHSQIGRISTPPQRA